MPKNLGQQTDNHKKKKAVKKHKTQKSHLSN